MLKNHHYRHHSIISLLMIVIILVVSLQIPIHAVADTSSNIPGSWEIYAVQSSKIRYNKNQLWALAGTYREIHFNSNGTVNIVFKGKTNQTATFYYGISGNTITIYTLAKQNGIIVKKAAFTWYLGNDYLMDTSDGTTYIYVPLGSAPALITNPQIIGEWKLDRVMGAEGQVTYHEEIKNDKSVSDIAITMYNNDTLYFSGQGKGSLHPYYSNENGFTAAGLSFVKHGNELWTDPGEGGTLCFIPSNQAYSVKEVVDLSKYLGTWYANAVYNPDSNTIYELDQYPELAGTSIIVNDNHTITISIPGLETATGTWEVKNDRFYIDGQFSDLYFQTSGGLWFYLGDSYYLVMSHSRPSIPTPTPEPTATPAPTEVPTLKGDVNADGIVDGRDLLRLARYMAGDGVTVNMAAADVNADGNVDGRDVLRLAKQLAGG